MRFRLLSACTILLTICVIAHADDTSSPKAAAKSFYAAVIRGDSAAVRQLLLVENDPDQQLAGGYADLILASKKLGDAAKNKFPNVPNAFAQATLAPEDAVHVDEANVNITGDTAILKFKDRQDPLKFKQVDGTWKLLVLQEKDSSEHRAAQMAMLQGLTAALNKTTDEIAADQFATVQDAENAVKERLGAVLAKSMQADQPSSKPASQP